MQKIDRLGWAAGLCFRAYGLKIGVRVNRAEVPAQVLECLPAGWEPAEPPNVDHLCSLFLGGAGPRPSVRTYHLLYGGLARLARTLELEEVWEPLETHLQRFVAEWSRGPVFVHAGVVGWRGRAIVLPGRSWSGKSTLVAALLRAGATYYSDEYAVLDEHGQVFPYPRRLSLRESAHRRRRCPPESFGSRAGVGPLPVGLVAVTKYHPGARWCPRPLSPGWAALELLNHTVPARREPDRVLSALQQVTLRAARIAGARGEADEVAGALLRAAER
jgi:hypothetical protein